MGGRASSSKKKLKRDKISSKKKSRRKESKKGRRNYDSVSSSSDDDSLYLERSLSSTSKSGHRRKITKNKKRRHHSSLSAYSESSDSDSSSTDYKIRKARRSRVGSKDIKRKGRKRSISSIGDVDATSGRKRKRLDRDHVIRPIKKPSKKKSKKVLGSSSSSDSESSTCQSGSSSSRADGKRQRKKLVYDKEKERVRGRGSDKDKKKHKDRSPSCTSIGRGGNPIFSVGYSDGEFFPVDNPRRLRSVIAVVDRSHDEENRWEKDPHKEEIVYDQNDYPSPKSLDSNEGGSKMESDNQFHVAFSDRICVENIVGEDVRELGKSRNDEGDHSNVGDRQLEGGYSEKEKEIDMSVPVAALGGDHLESILRQKALENLRKFRERPRTCPRSNIVKINNETNVARLSGETVDNVQNKSIEQGSSDAQEIAEVVKLPDSELVEKKPGMAKLSITQREIAEAVKLPDSEHVEKKPGMAKLSITHSHNGAALLECSEEDRSAYSRAVVAKAVSGSSTSPGAGGTKACSSSNVELTSSVEPTSGEHSSEKRNEAKDGSQFEQKTMSVMRGGELVQVSYKVYIPKKPPGLARRQLKR